MATRVHELLARHDVVIFPGVYDALGAKIAARDGFELLFISGYSVAATHLGEPDFGLLTQMEMVEAARRICRAVDRPVIVDADTGYGNALNVVRTVNELIAAGAAGMFLEDQVWPKRCGHLRGKRVIPMEEQAAKLHAALDARAGRDFFIVARTDAREAVGLEEAIRRARAYKAAGADAVFIEAPRTVEELKDELKALGYQLVVFPLSALYASARAIEAILTHLRRAGTTRDGLDRLLAFQEFHSIIGLDEKYAQDARYRAPDEAGPDEAE